MAIQVNLRRRWFGLFHLIVSGGLLIWGLTLLRPVLRGWLFVAYWFSCFVFALLALITGWLDWRSVRRQARAERRELLLESLRRGKSGQSRTPESRSTRTPRPPSPHPRP
jgi:membrane protein implicated in regulation of membrane protease activity